MKRRQILFLQQFGQQIRQINPVDYRIWSVLQEIVYRSRIAGVEELKQRLATEWANRDHWIISEAVGQ